MNTRSRNTLLAAVVFLALTGVLIGISTSGKLQQESGANATPTEAPPDVLFPNAASHVAKAIVVTDNTTGDTFAAHTDTGDTWTIDTLPSGADASLPTDSSRIGGALISLPSVRPIRVLTQIEAISPYGLDNPKYTVTFTTDDNKAHLFYVGTLNPDGDAYYVRLTQDPTLTTEVYLVPNDVLDEVLNFVSDPPLVQPTPEVTPTP